MRRFLPSLRARGRRVGFLAVITLVALGAGAWMTKTCQAQISPVMPAGPNSPAGPTFAVVLYQNDMEVGRVFRDVAGPVYTEHWVLYPNFTFDQPGLVGQSFEIVSEPGPGYVSVQDFLARVPFPAGSRYVIASCQETDSLPGR